MTKIAGESQPAVVRLMCCCVQISHCSGSSSTQSRGEAESEASPVAAVASAPPPPIVTGPWQPSFHCLCVLSLSAHYRHNLHHPLHYRRYVAPVQHYRSTPAAVSGAWANESVLCWRVECSSWSQSVWTHHKLSASYFCYFTTSLSMSLCSITVEPLQHLAVVSQNVTI